ncbi:hypothetical protein AB205_0136540 [Aquarana catesbeiana]|uniref:Uncharacterized protein n=1 Tax=Aquarana catesbeiana TaxID=8400 RepID=A0A2G9R5Y0_AQUCT|nr:hypothetical protein AB205_0136540 [Aquarana catesbeiana]
MFNKHGHSFSPQLSVDTLTFLLFLYIQQINKVSLRTSLIGEEWPSPRARSPSPDLAGQSNFHKPNDSYSADLLFREAINRCPPVPERFARPPVISESMRLS